MGNPYEIPTNHGVKRVKRFFARQSVEHTHYGQGEPDAVVFETDRGSIMTIFSTSDHYETACATQDAWFDKQELFLQENRRGLSN